MRLLITGASGQLGGYLLRQARQDRLATTAWSGVSSGVLCGFPLVPVDLEDPKRVEAAFAEARPDAVLHAAALAQVATCHKDPERARRVNVAATAQLARLAAGRGARFLLVSTDLVFDGEKGGYLEGDPPGPLSTYGRTKVEAEEAVRHLPETAVVRASLLYGPSLTGRAGFFDQQVAALRSGRPVTLFEDEWRTPVDLATAARALLRVLRSSFTGTIHLGGPERLSRVEMGERLARHLGVSPGAIVRSRRADVPAGEPRPRDTSLSCELLRATFPDLPWPTYEASLAALLPAGEQEK